MSGPGRFDSSELRASGKPADDEPSDAELAEALTMARELEALSTDAIRPTDGFEDRVMAAIATEPAPRLVVRHSSAVRGGRAGAFLVAVGDAWRVATSGGRPIAIRAQALAFVLVVVLAAGALTTATAITVGGFLQSRDAASPSAEPSPSSIPTPSAPATPSTAPTPSQTTEPSETPEATETLEPGETPEANETPKPGETPRPTRTPRPTDTPNAGDTPEPTGTDDHGGGGGSGDDGGGGSGPG